ncbi:MAG: MalY/PatB family protein [Steroidobacteraceae bacterium]
MGSTDVSASRVEIPSLETLRRHRGRKWSTHRSDVLPAWIADMDMLPAPIIRAALRMAIEEGDLGYGPTAERSGIGEVFSAWALHRWQWQVEAAVVMLMPDVVSGLSNCIEALTSRGDGVLVQTPIYPPILSCIEISGRRVVACASVGASIDFAALEAAIAQSRPRLFILCNPHNPTGRCFTRVELTRLAALAADYDLDVVSDEIHADLVHPGHQHIPFASLSAQEASRTVTLNSASKAFNVAGLRCAVCVAQSVALRRQLSSLPAQRWTTFSTVGVRAALAAWTEAGEAWLIACVEHLTQMRDHLAQRLTEELPAMRCVAPQAGYLAWLDCRELGLGGAPAQFFLERARVALSPGSEFGEPGHGFVRLNFATSQDILDRILDRMIKACQS